MNLVTISEYPAPIEWAFSMNSTGEIVHINQDAFTKRSQDLAKYYYDTGTFAVFNTKDVQNSDGASSKGKYIGYVLPKGSAIDIDTEEDWELAEKIYKAN